MNGYLGRTVTVIFKITAYLEDVQSSHGGGVYDELAAERHLTQPVHRDQQVPIPVHLHQILCAARIQAV